MRNWLTIKLSRAVSRVGGLYGGGSALPGLIVEKTNPDFVKRALASLPLGVVVISGTNGKTSTTKMVTQILQEQGLMVFTNKTGSNFLRGIASSLLKQCDSKGRIKADIAILELDEAHAVHFVNQIPPTYSLLLNVMRDQLDRFGEVDKVVQLLKEVALATTKEVVLNREDSHLLAVGKTLPRVVYFGYGAKVKAQFKTLDDESTDQSVDALVMLDHHGSDNFNTYKIGNQKLVVKFKINGLYNHYNAAGAIALVQTILGDDLNMDRLKNSLTNIEPAFGRGESFTINGRKLELVLVKNPSGFQMSINSLANPDTDIMIAINDNYADGRDVSWLFDVDFSGLPDLIHTVSGSRSKDMANRLKYDLKQVKYADPKLELSLKRFLDQSTRNMQLYSTYTAMLFLRKQLLKKTNQDRRNFR